MWIDTDHSDANSRKSDTSVVKQAAGIGTKLRTARLRKGDTLQGVADACGLTKGFLSSIERDKASPSVASLIRICEYLLIPVGSLFESRLPMVVRADRRSPIDYGGDGIVYALMNAQNARFLRAIYGELEPGGSSGIETHTYAAKEEFIFLLSGSLTVRVDTDEYHLNAGDCITFDPNLAHGWHNSSSTEKARAICILCIDP